MVLTQANSLRFANQTSTRSFFLPTRVNSKFKCLKFLTRVPRGPLTVTSRLFSLIVTTKNKIKDNKCQKLMLMQFICKVSESSFLSVDTLNCKNTAIYEVKNMND